jgi:hypothetical protein
MILVKTYRQDNKILKISIKGHANYKNYGNDIVCAAVSSVAICTVNAILSFDKNNIDVKENSGNLEITVLKQDDIVITLLNNMLRCLKDIETDYPTNIKLSKEE